MPYVKTSRPCVRCGAVSGTLYGVEGQGRAPELCVQCFNGGRGVFDMLNSLWKRVRA